MVIKQSTADFNINLEYTWADGGTWANNPQVHWGPMLDVEVQVFNNTVQVNGTTDLTSPHSVSVFAGVTGRSSASFDVDAEVDTLPQLRLRGSPISISALNTQLSSTDNIIRGTSTFTVTATQPPTKTNNILRSTKSFQSTNSLQSSTDNIIRGTKTLQAPTLTLTLARYRQRAVVRTHSIPAELTGYKITSSVRVNNIQRQVTGYRIANISRRTGINRENREYASNNRF